MSYLPGRGPLAVDGFFDPIRGAPFSNSTCFADADARTADMFAKQQDLSKNWNPTGFYTPADMRKVFESAFAMMTAAGAVLDKAMSGTQDLTSRGQLMDARDSIFDQEGKGLQFSDALRNAAVSHIEIIESTGFKRWVIGCMEVTKAAMFTAHYVACNRSALLDLLVGVLNVLIDAADLLVAVAKVVVGVAKATVELALELGKQIIKIPDTIATIVKVSIFAGVALGAYWLWGKHGGKPVANPRRRRRR